MDATTEITEGELFDFDAEVQPILETLIGRTLQQALTEVIHEEEIADLRVQQQKMMASREAEMAELRRLEEQENRLQGEKVSRAFAISDLDLNLNCTTLILKLYNQERRYDEDQMADQLDRQMLERVTAAKLLQGHIADLLPSVLESIESVRDAENKEELQRKLTPWLAEEVASEIGQMIDSRELLLEIVKEVLQHRAELYAKFEEDEDSPTEGGSDM